MESPTTPYFTDPCPPSQIGDPSWQIALLFPAQGSWTEDDYLALNTNWLIEFSEGCIEVLPMPTLFHQRIVQFLYHLLHAYVQEQGAGEVLFAPLPVRISPAKFREPDIVYLGPARVCGDRYPEGADLAVEVVSEGEEARQRDLETKRVEYAKSGIGEYWIVDPQEREIHVLSLDGDAYRLHGKFGIDDVATSVLLSGFAAVTKDVFAVGNSHTP